MHTQLDKTHQHYASQLNILYKAKTNTTRLLLKKNNSGTFRLAGLVLLCLCFYYFVFTMLI